MKMTALLFSLGLMAAASQAAPAAKPNVILIYSDDHGYADLGAQGVDKDIRTPQLDALARDGVRFTRGYVTAPQCVPSRAGVITGRYQQRFGVDDNLKGPLPLAELTIAERLKAAGYVSAHVGKWHLEPTPRSDGKAEPGNEHAFSPAGQGFEEYYTGQLNTFMASHDLQGARLPNAPQRQSDRRFRCVWQADAAISFVERHARDPFFLYLAFFTPHVPLESPEPWFAQTPAHLPLERRQALAMIAAMDDGIGRLRTALRALGLEKNTLIFFIADNGAPLKSGAWNGSLNLPHTGEKGMLTDGGIRVPFVAAWPGTLPAGKVYAPMVSSLDVAATAVALAGLPSDAKLDGVNLVPFLTSEKTGAPHDALFWRWRSQAAVLDGRWKLVLLGGQQRYLFDTTAPEGETRNLIAQHSEIADRLHLRLKAWDTTLQSPGLPAETHPQDQVFFDAHVDKKPTAQPRRDRTRRKRKKPRNRASATTRITALVQMNLTRALLVSLAANFASLASAASPAKPNLVFILADDLGWSDTTFNAPNAFYETPNIQRLAQRGMRFTQAYAANPLCSPTRASIQTGLHPARIGLTSPSAHLPQVILEKSTVKNAAPTAKVLVAQSITRLDPSYFTLAEALKGAGYATGHFGKWHLGSEPYSPLQQGFDVDFPHWHGPGPAGSYVAPWKFPAELNFPSQPDEHIEDRMATEAITFIKTHRNEPFYVNYWAFSVHAPYDAKPALIEKYRAKAAKLPPGSAQRNPVFGAMVQSLDENVGRLLDTLDELKLTENTIIVFFSDNGGVHWLAGTPEATKAAGITDIPITSNAPLRGGKATTYEGGTREPCIIAWPGLTKPGVASTAIIQSTDFFPTFADVLKLKIPDTLKFDGKSFAPALRGATHDRGPTFCHFPHNTPAAGGLASTWVRVGDWKLIRFYCLNDDQTDLLELYNLEDDLGETRNLAAQQPAKVKELNALITGFLQDTAAVVPQRNPNYDPRARSSPTPKSKAKQPAAAP